MTRLPRQFLTSWVNHPRPHGRPQYTYGHSLTKSLKRTGIPPVFKEWSQLAQDRSNWRKLFYSKAEFPPTRQNWSFCSHFCMYFSHFRTSESIDVQSSAMQTHLHSKLLVIWIYLEGYLIIIIHQISISSAPPRFVVHAQQFMLFRMSEPRCNGINGSSDIDLPWFESRTRWILRVIMLNSPD